MSSQSPKVSVIVPVHNVEKYLRQCLDSLVTQTLQDIEIIVVDDGSTDGSGAIAREYARRYSNVRSSFDRTAAFLPRATPASAQARGEYVGCLDADDWADVRMFQWMYERAAKDDADYVIADARIFYEGPLCFSAVCRSQAMGGGSCALQAGAVLPPRRSRGVSPRTGGLETPDTGDS